MNKNITRLQLIDSKVKGFLDVKSGADAPINLSISDIRDISSRSGMYSKTITLSGTKNNNKLLNNYFEVNVVDGTFNVNKKQKVALIQNGVVIKDNCFMRLLKVVKKQNLAANIDDYVEYEVQITDGLGDFFKDVSNKELKELTGWESFSHIFNVDNIVGSFSNTVDDGYKYILPHITKGSNGESRYQIGEIMPGIYAKQIFDKIHEQNGMTYEWATLDHKDFQFDKAIIPYSGDVKKLSEEFIEENKVIVENINKQDTKTEPMGSGVSNGFIAAEIINFTDKIKDETNKFDLINNLYNNSLIISNPDSLVYKVSIDYDVVFVNDGSSDITLAGAYQTFRSGLTLRDENNTSLLTKYVPVNIDSNYSGVLQHYGDDETKILISPFVPFTWSPGEHYVAKNAVTDFTFSISELNDTNQISLRIFAGMQNSAGSNWDMKMRITINNIYVEILPNTQNGLLPGAVVDLRKCLPSKIKQSEFLKSVYQKYNLYPLPDKDDPNHLIYVTRDEFYDSGDIKDWTDKLSKGQNQELIFLPDITTKKMTLSYKDDDKDPVLTAYRDETLKTFGQVSALFESENVKGEERKEEIFSPTISLTSDFGAVLPVLAPDFKMNIRYLQDGGELGCNNYQIIAGGVITNHLSYPFVSMFDKPYNPTFSIEYALSDYYAYNIGTPKKNTLYDLHWRRTLSQINEGKMLKAYFYLDEKDISLLKLNDKIKVNNTLYYINKVIDYNANDFKPTKVELLTVEDDLQLPRVGNTVVFNPSVIDLDAELADGLTPSTPVVVGGFFVESISKVIRKRINSTTVVSRPTLLDGNMGVGNTIPEDFRGIILGDGIQVDYNGIYISDEVQLTEDGLKLKGTLDLTDVTVEFPELDDKEDKSNKVQDLNNPDAITYPSTNAVKNALDGKVESVTGTGVDNTDPINPVINIDKNTIGLGNVDNTSDLAKPISTATQTALNGKEDKVNKVQDLSSPDSTTYPSTQAVYDAMQNIGGGGIVNITYTSLKTLKNNNNLQKGVRYYITDRDIWVDALDTDKLSMSAKRHFRIVKDEYYTPHTVQTPFGTISYLGIYGQTYDRGSTPYSSSTISGTTYYAIWGGRMWVRQNNLTGSPDTPGTSDQTIAGGWTLQATTNNTYYESKIFDIKYNFDEDIIYEQADDRGNIVTVTNTGASYIDFLDWGNELIFNNKCYGFRNNFNGSSPASIYNNYIDGYIANNSNNGVISDNTNIGNIYRNSNNGGIVLNTNHGNITGNSAPCESIYNNSNLRHIDNNSNEGNIDYNSNNDSIRDNSNKGLIRYNSNNGAISINSNRGDILSNSNLGNITNNSGLGNTTMYTATANIEFNSNTGDIANNSNRGDILYNSNLGDINNNSSVFTTSSTTFLTISYNSNSGYINYNRSTLLNRVIKNNRNNGRIGGTSIVDRSTDVTDTIVNK